MGNQRRQNSKDRGLQVKNDTIHKEMFLGREVAAAHDRLQDSWKNGAVPAIQWSEAVQWTLDAWRAGGEITAFRAALDCIKRSGANDIADIGCSSGYYLQVLRERHWNGHYTGVDYSDAMIALATEKYGHDPLARWVVADAAKTPFQDGEFGAVISGGVIMHMKEWKPAIFEMARIARSHVILHRTQVVKGREHRSFTKTAYGVEMAETWFGEQTLHAVCCTAGLVLEHEVELSANQEQRNVTWLLKKS